MGCTLLVSWQGRAIALKKYCDSLSRKSKDRKTKSGQGKKILSLIYFTWFYLQLSIQSEGISKNLYLKNIILSKSSYIELDTQIHTSIPCHIYKMFLVKNLKKRNKDKTKHKQTRKNVIQ